MLSFFLAQVNFAHAQCGTTPPTGSVSWTTHWCDEFNGALNSPIDGTKWTYDTGNSGFGNNELETYCNPASNASPCRSTTPNAYIDGNGNLAIQVLEPASNTWTSARLKTEGLVSFNAGRIEARLQMPSHIGLWPAFWLLGSQAGVSWPTVGEADIMENWPATVLNGPGATGNRSTIHTQLTGGPGMGGAFNFPAGQQVDTAFHIYGEIWSANMMQFYVDNPSAPFFVVTASDLPAGDSWPFSSAKNPFFVILNIAVGGTLGGTPDAQTGSQAPMLVDYVRQYLPSMIPAPQLAKPSDMSLPAGATTGNTTTLNISQNQGSGRVAFSCTTTAPKASCSVSSSDPVNSHTVDFSNASNASATITVSTTANTQLSAMTRTGTGFVALAILVLGLPLGKWRKTQLQSRARVAAMSFALGLAPACGNKSSGAAPGGGGGNGTPPGNYRVTVNTYSVTSSDASIPSASTSFGLTVN